LRTLRRPWAWANAHEDRIRAVTAVLAAALPILFLLAALVQAAPFVDDVPLDSREGDDWVSYKLFAHSVYRDGLSMPVMAGAYGAQEGTVHGFLYIYFVAGVFAVFGENSSFVYVVQSALIGAAASLVHLGWRRVLSPLAALAVLLGAALLAFADIYRSIGFRLLSENLFVFLLAATFAAYVEAHWRRSAWLATGAGILLGLAVLSRTNFLVAGLCLLAAAAAYARIRAAGVAIPAMLGIGFAVGMLPLPLRELAATGAPDLILLKPNPGDLYPPPTGSIGELVEHYVRRVLFTIGFTTAQEPGYRWRPHWLLLWSGALAWLIWRVRRPRLDPPETFALLVIVTYLGPVIALSYPSNYGARMITVALPIVLGLAILGFDRWARGRDGVSRPGGG